MDRALQANIIAKSGKAVEVAGDVDTLLLDKTGTITIGNRQAAEFLPVGGVEQLITQPAKNPLQASEAIRAEHVGTLGQSLFWLVVAIIGAFLAALPVTWVYMAVRSGDEYDQSLINTILLLPMVVTGIVIIVQNSLALAFSLAGIADGGDPEPS